MSKKEIETNNTEQKVMTKYDLKMQRRKEEKEKETGHYIRRERYAGACSRSFYVGEGVKQEDIKGEFKHGILKMFVPKKEAKPAVEENKYIAIE